jgi:hypothetical protein
MRHLLIITEDKTLLIFRYCRLWFRTNKILSNDRIPSSDGMGDGSLPEMVSNLSYDLRRAKLWASSSLSNLGWNFRGKNGMQPPFWRMTQCKTPIRLTHFSEDIQRVQWEERRTTSCVSHIAFDVQPLRTWNHCKSTNFRTIWSMLN